MKFALVSLVWHMCGTNKSMITNNPLYLTNKSEEILHVIYDYTSKGEDELTLKYDY